VAFPNAPLPDGASVGDAGHVSDHNLIVAALAEVRDAAIPNDLIVSGNGRNGAPARSGSIWTFTDPGRAYFYPVFYGTAFSINALAVHVRNPGPTGATLTLGLFTTRTDMWRPGAPVASTTVTADTSGWKQGSFTTVSGLAAGWYWHACLSLGTGGMDVHSTGPIGVAFDPPTIENAIRVDGNVGRCLATDALQTGFTTNPTVSAFVLSAPTVAVGFP